MDDHGVRLCPDAPVDEGPPPNAPLACRDILDAQIVDVAGKRVRRVSDVWLRGDAGALRIAGLDTSWRSLFRRLRPGAIGDGAATTAIDWADVHLTASGRHALTLGMPTGSLRRLSAPELSELVARLPPDRGAAVLEAVEPGHAASALSVARPRMGGRMMQTLSSDTAGGILAELPVDDAVAALRHVEEGQGAALLEQIPTARAAELRRLLALPPRTAGGLMRSCSSSACPSTAGATGGRRCASVRRTKRLAILLAVVGPGLLAGLSDDDPAGITTYSILGAEHGYQLLWVLTLSTAALVVFHEIAAAWASSPDRDCWG